MAVEAVLVPPVVELLEPLPLPQAMTKRPNSNRHAPNQTGNERLRTALLFLRHLREALAKLLKRLREETLLFAREVALGLLLKKGE